jgi:formate hydrogenlyase subunit 3/multisubunit Na+/H+ antiporter MnhD subunit
MIAVLLLFAIVLPTVLLIAWFVVLSRWDVPGRWFFGIGAALVVLTVLWGNSDRAAEQRSLPYDCRTGARGGLECGFGLGGMLQYANAVFATILLLILAAVSFQLWLSDRRRETAGSRGQWRHEHGRGRHEDG